MLFKKRPKTQADYQAGRELYQLRAEIAARRILQHCLDNGLYLSHINELAHNLHTVEQTMQALCQDSLCVDSHKMLYVTRSKDGLILFVQKQPDFMNNPL